VRKGQPVSQVVALAGAIFPETIEDNGFYLRIWRLHPQGVDVCPAEKTLRGGASSAALRWCGPFAHANAYGFWVFPQSILTSYGTAAARLSIDSNRSTQTTTRES
jgi:hypothetical protein